MPMREWRKDNAYSRLDSEYQIKAHLTAIALLKQFGAIQFKDDQPEVIHPKEITRQYVEEGGIWFLRAQNVRPLRIDPTNQMLISQGDANILSRNELEAGDVLITRTGANRGECAIYDRKERAIASSHTFIVRPKKIDPQFLAVFLNSHFGKAQINRGVYGAAQPEIAPYYLRNIWLPTVGVSLVFRIKWACDASKTEMAFSEIKQTEAEETLLTVLGLADWMPSEPLNYTMRASDIFAAGRMDAQYFMPAKEQVRLSLAAMPGRSLGKHVDSIREMFLPESTPATMKLRNYDVTDALLPLLSPDKEPSFADEIGSVKKTLHDGDVVISRLRAYLKEIAVVRKLDDIPLIGSSEFIVLRPKKDGVSPETLMVFLRSAPVQTVLKWCQDGSQHPRFSEGDLLSIHVPDAVAEVSAEITAIVKEGFAARHRAHQLLETAKRAIEIAIEDGEVAAMTFLDQAEETS